GGGWAPAGTAAGVGEGGSRRAWGRDGPAAPPLRPRRAGNGRGGVRMARTGVTADTTGGVSGVEGEGETRPREAGRRVLVVEDHRDAADCLRLLLECCGHEVAVAYTGPDGVRAAEQYRPDVVLCDIGL